MTKRKKETKKICVERRKDTKREKKESSSPLCEIVLWEETSASISEIEFPLQGVQKQKKGREGSGSREVQVLLGESGVLGELLLSLCHRVDFR
jgi:hypothetical protein